MQSQHTFTKKKKKIFAMFTLLVMGYIVDLDIIRTEKFRTSDY